MGSWDDWALTLSVLIPLIGAIVIAGRRGRYGIAEDGSVEPPLQPDEEPAR